jgi:ribosomal protein S18 acetylase RimI-like enzyme
MNHPDQDAMTQLEIATGADVDAIVRLVNDAYRGASKAPGWTNESALLSGQRTGPASVKQLMQSGVVLIARGPGTVLGCVALQPRRGGEWYLSMLAVDPDQQTSGLGKTIMNEAEAFARTRGARHIRISVINVRDALLAWYERRGYVRTGAVEPFPYHDPNVGHALRDDLTLVTLIKPV